MAYVVSGDDYLRLFNPSTGALLDEYYLPPLVGYDPGVPPIYQLVLKPDRSELWIPLGLAYGNGVFDTQAKTFTNMRCGEGGTVDFSPGSSTTYAADEHGGVCASR